GFQGGGIGMGGPGGAMGGVPNFSQSYTLAVWDVSSGKLLRRLKGHSGRVEALAYHPGGKLVATASDEAPRGLGVQDGPGMVRLWDPVAGREVRALKVSKSGAVAVAFSPDGKLLATGNWEGFALWRADTATLVRRINILIPGTDRLACLAFSPSGKTLATGNHHAIRLWDVATGKESSAVGHTKGIDRLDLSPHGPLLPPHTGPA